MNQEVAAGFAVFVAGLSYVAIWHASTLGGKLDEQASTIKRCRAMLQAEAAEALENIEDQIAKIRERAGGASSIALIDVDPDQMLAPTERFVELVRLDDRVERMPARLQQRSQVAFWASIVMAVVSSANLYIALFVFEASPTIGFRSALATLTLVLLVGGVPMLFIATGKRSLDRALVRANSFDSRPAPGETGASDWEDA